MGDAAALQAKFEAIVEVFVREHRGKRADARLVLPFMIEADRAYFDWQAALDPVEWPRIYDPPGKDIQFGAAGRERLPIIYFTSIPRRSIPFLELVKRGRAWRPGPASDQVTTCDVFI